MGLYDRLLGRDDIGNPAEGKIPIHAFRALLREFATNRITGAEAQALVARISGAPLAPAEVAEANTLLATVTGSLTAKIARADEIDGVLLLAETVPGPWSPTEKYDTPTQVKIRLGV